MSSHPEALDHMLAAWNERDPQQVRAHLERALAHDVVFIDPSVETYGIDEFEANVHEVHRQLPTVQQPGQQPVKPAATRYFVRGRSVSAR